MVRACMSGMGMASAVAPSSSCSSSSSPAARRVLLLGGTGRAGGAAATALSDLRPDLSILVAGRNMERGTHLVSKLGERSEFVQLDIHDARRLEAVMEGVDLVVHAAGPFQREDKCRVLQAAISTKTGYVDVCDGMDYSWRAKSLHEEAKAAGVPALITAGISPGVSNVMAAELVRAAKSKNYGEPERLRSGRLAKLGNFQNMKTVKVAYFHFYFKPTLLNSPFRFFYYIAGTGGAGPTALGTSFLLLGEDVIAYNKGREIKLKPYSGARNIDFGKGIGKKDVYLLTFCRIKISF